MHFLTVSAALVVRYRVEERKIRRNILKEIEIIRFCIISFVRNKTLKNLIVLGIDHGFLAII